MFLDDRLSAKYGRKHQVAQILVVDARVHLKQKARAAGGNERVVKFPIVSPQGLLLRPVPGGHAPFQRRELVMRRNDASLPFHVACLERAAQCVAFEKLAHASDLAQVVARDRGDFETARALGSDEPFRREAVEDFTQGAHRRAIGVSHSIQCQFLAGRKASVDDVGPDAAVGRFPYRRTWGRGMCRRLPPGDHPPFSQCLGGRLTGGSIDRAGVAS